MISNVIAWAMVATFATLPFSSSLANGLGILVLLLWIAEGDLKRKWSGLWRNPVALLPLLYLLVLAVGLLWSTDVDWGVHVIKKSRRFLLLPVFLSVALDHPQVFRRGLYAFLVSVTLTVACSVAIVLDWIPLFGHATEVDPSPFVYHTSYAPELAWAGYLCFAAARFDRRLSARWKVGLCGAGLFILTGLFLNIGVSGYAAALMLLGLFVLQWRKQILLPIVVMGLLAGAVFWLSPTVHRRVIQNVDEVLSYRQGEAAGESPDSGRVKNSSVGPRLVFWANTWQIIRQHPLLGVGTGDFPAEYEAVRQERTPDHWKNVDHPHNMYLQIWAQSGVLGLGVIACLFVALLVRSRRGTPLSSTLLVGVSCFMLLIMLSDSYLQIAPISLLFVLFAGVGSAYEPLVDELPTLRS